MELEKKKQEKKKTALPNYAKFSGIGISMIAIIGAGTYLGSKLDDWLHLTFPLFTFIGIFVSVGVAIYRVIKLID